MRSYSRGDGEYNTNQRLEFELDECGRRLFVGGSNSNDGLFVRIYDVTSGRLGGSLNVLKDDVLPGDGGSCTWRNDAVNGISFFPTHNGGGGGGPGIKYDGLLAVAVGSRRY